jgi:hypothetical protein
MRNRDRSAKGEAERVEFLWRLYAEAMRRSIRRLVLQVLEHTAVKVICSVLRREGNVTDLRELCAVVERCYFDCDDSLLRRISVLQRTVLPNVRGRKTVDRKFTIEELALPSAMFLELSVYTLGDSAKAPSGLVVVRDCSEEAASSAGCPLDRQAWRSPY